MDDDEDAAEASDAVIALADAAARIVGWGASHVLVTGTHENTGDVVNVLYGERDGRVVALRADHWPRLPGSYHGSGCTLAAMVAALLAGGATMDDAVRDAQRATWDALAAAFRPGMGQFIPDRFHWARTANGFAGRASA